MKPKEKKDINIDKQLKDIELRQKALKKILKVLNKDNHKFKQS